jgi:uncharacterized protein
MEQTAGSFRADLAPVVIGLPTADRHRSFDFYATALGLEPIGDLAEDGFPEPLQFVLNDGARLVLIPTGGFGWITSNRPTASPGTSECLLTMVAADQDGVVELIERARQGGAEVVSEPTEQPWGYAATFADPDGHGLASDTTFDSAPVHQVNAAPTH